MDGFADSDDPRALRGARQPAYRTGLGSCYHGDSLELLRHLPDGCVDLVMTSPPFALQRRKEYGNESQADYVAWLASFVAASVPKLREGGSIVLDIGGAYEAGTPSRSLYPFRVLLHLCDTLGLHLAQDFYWSNRSKLPSPIEWVNKRKMRAKDIVNTVFWLSPTPWPKADTRRVLRPYSESMTKLIARGGGAADRLRPSGHVVTANFARDNGGALPGNLLDFPNTESNGRYLDACRRHGGKAHPARFPRALPDFFIRMLTEPGDLVLDVFGGSNTTGEAAELLGRRWLAFEQRPDYVASSAFRFLPKWVAPERAAAIHAAVLDGWTVDLSLERPPAPARAERAPRRVEAEPGAMADLFDTPAAA